MTALEEIEAAIEKLTELQSSSTDGRWELFHAYDGYEIVTVNDRVTFGGLSSVSDGAIPDVSDAYLVVTLHRTIDAQLAILRDAAFTLGSIAQFRDCHAELVLARAINGGD